MDGVSDSAPWMALHSGGRLHCHAPAPDQVRLEDVATSLGKLCRYLGHCNGFYSVAEHSVLVSRWLEVFGVEVLRRARGLGLREDEVSTLAALGLKAPGEAASKKLLAAVVGVRVPVMEGVLKRLSARGYVDAEKGPGAGWDLSKLGRKVAEAMEGE